MSPTSRPQLYIDGEFHVAEKIPVGDAEIVEQVLFHQLRRFIAQAVGFHPYHDRAMLEREAVPVEIGLHEFRQGRFARLADRV